MARWMEMSEYCRKLNRNYEHERESDGLDYPIEMYSYGLYENLTMANCLGVEEVFKTLIWEEYE